MVKLIKGYAGSGKTIKMIEDIYSLINNDNANPYQILVLTLTPSEKEQFESLNKQQENAKHLNIWSIDDLYRYILKKSPLHLENKILPDFLAINAIGAICKTEFIKNTALNSLTKSNSFFRELYNLFGLFKNNEITPGDFIGIIDDADASETDKIRLRIISTVFKRYDDIIGNYGYIDYRDAVIQATEALKNNELLLSTVKLKFPYIFIDGFEDITYLQFKLIKLLANPDCLNIYGDEYSRIQEFRGAWRDNLILESLEEHFKNIEITNLNSSKRNEEILERAVYLVKRYNLEEYKPEFGKSDKIKYLQFEDIQSEISYIARDIADKIKEEGCRFSDFAILIRDFESKQKFIDFFKTYGIPVNSELYNEDYRNFKLKLSRYLNICNLCEIFGLKEFSQEAFEKINIKSKTESEILFDELNLYIENILSDAVEENYAKDRFISIKEENNKISLLNVLFENLSILKDSDKEALLKEFDDLSQIYRLYKDKKFVELLIFTAKQQEEYLNNPEFNIILGKLISRINSLSDLYRNVLREKPDFIVLNEIINQSFEEKSELTDSVNLLTFFKTAGLEFKYVYIPCLTENSFPKKAKSTYFVAPDTNEIISNKIKQKNNNFRHLIELDEDSIKEESRLFYLGMTRAKEKLLISTHVYEDKKQVQPSVFFRLLAEADNENFEKSETKQNDNQEEQVFKNTESEKILNAKVIGENEQLKLSASSIGTFLSCPRKYYYKSLLSLKEKSAFAANYGSIVHSIMEVFNKTCLDKYTKECLLNLTETLFNAKNNSQNAINIGFKERDIELIKASDDLNLAEMKENFVNAVDLMEQKSFFADKPEKTETEKWFTFSLDGLPDVVFDGKIDVIYKTGGKYSVIDYKTGKNKDQKLEYYISDNGVNFLTKTGKEPSKIEDYQNGYEYQIPVYYLACQNAEELEEYKDKVGKLGLKYIRPASKDDGYNEDLIKSTEIETRKEKIIQNLKETVIDKILTEDNFKQKRNYMTCSNCSFNFLCDEEGEDDNEE